MDLRLTLIFLCSLCVAPLAAAQSAATSPTTRPAFVMGPDKSPFTPWGLNYDRDYKSRLIEDYWESEWPTVEQDFREMKQLGANVVRVHLQFAKFMDAPGQPNPKSLAQLVKLAKLAEEVGIYLDLTGLACYRNADVPAWYDQLSEPQRWAQQAAFWEAVAGACADSPSVFCYDLINEPVVPIQKVDTWLDPHELAGFSYVQFIVKDLAGRDREQTGRQWVHQMVQAIRRHDKNRLVTLGMLPIVGSGFHPRDMARELDYLSVHIYPASGKLDESLKLLKDFQHGKPVVIEEIFPLGCTIPELEDFIHRSRGSAHGWIGFYWGKSPDELRESPQIGDKVLLSWLELFSKMRSDMAGP